MLYCFAGCTYVELYAAIARLGLLPEKKFEIPESVIAVETAIASYSWRTRTGETDRDVLRAHLAIAKRVRSDQYGASIREVCELAKVESLNTVCIAQDRLTDAGWLVRLEPGNEEKAARWQIQVGCGEGSEGAS